MNRVEAFQYIRKCHHYKSYPMIISKQLAKKIMDNKIWNLRLELYRQTNDKEIIQIQDFLNKFPIYLTYHETKKLKFAMKLLSK